VRRNDGRQSYCRECRKLYLREHYASNAAQYRKAATSRNELRRNAVRQIIREAKDRECADCGIRYPFYVMDFDHRRGLENLFNIGRDALGGRCSLDGLRREIAKCDVVCANCHRLRTHRGEVQLGRQDSNLD
jgi:5-methylcytosine-specific restriction endonuclease McrA